MEELNFDEMRNQIAILKAKLNNQDIVNDRMMHQVVNTKADNMKRVMISAIFCAVFVILVGPYSFHKSLGTSWAFVIGTDVMMLYCGIREFLFKRQINNKDLMNASLLEVAKKMIAFKKSYRRYTLSNMLVIMPVWLIWLFIETFISKSREEAIFFSIAMVIGLVIGGSIGIWMYFRIQHEATDIIKQIEE